MKYNKLCSFDMDIAEKLNNEPNRKSNLVIVEAVKAHYDNMIIPKNCQVKMLDVTDLILAEIKTSVEVDNETKMNLQKISSFHILKDNEGKLNKIHFYLRTWEIEIYINFKIFLDEEIHVQFIKWDKYSNYNIDFDEDRLKEIENSVIFKL